MDRLSSSRGPRISCELGNGSRITHKPINEVHRIIEWAKAVLGNTDHRRLRQAVLEGNPNLVQAIPGVEILRANEVTSLTLYAQANKWAEIEPDLTRIALSLPSTDSMAQKEVVGLTSLVQNTLKHTSAGRTLLSAGIYLYTGELYVRTQGTLDFGDNEDFLGSIGNVVRINGQQVEAEAKATALDRNSQRLAQIQGKITVQDITEIYADTVKEIRPGANDIPVFRDFEIDFDEPLSTAVFVFGNGNQELGPYLQRSAAGRERAVELFLHRYNNRLDRRQGGEAETLAWVWATYLSIHPHPDYNGTMARTLTNSDLIRRGFPPIDWRHVKQDSKILKDLEYGRGRYVFASNEAFLQRWFREQIPTLT